MRLKIEATDETVQLWGNSEPPRPIWRVVRERSGWFSSKVNREYILIAFDGEPHEGAKIRIIDPDSKTHCPLIGVYPTRLAKRIRKLLAPRTNPYRWRAL